jgi:SAM-dependent methyltransferase
MSRSLVKSQPVDVAHTACPVCGGLEFEFHRRGCRDRLYWLPGRFEIDRCKGCSVMVTVPSPSGDELAAYYPTDYVSFGSGKHPTPALIRVLGSLVQLPYLMRYGSVDRTPPAKVSGGALLDIGCGAGAYMQKMRQLGWDVYGIEPSPSAAASAGALGISPDRIFVGYADEADWPDASFDLITLSHVLEHLPEPRRTLGNTHRWLRRGGRVRIWVPNVESLESRVFGGLWFGLDVPRHLVHYSPTTIRRLLEGAGFVVEKIAPEYQGVTLLGSLAHVASAVAGRHRRYRHSAGLHRATLPLASLLLGLGSRPTLDVTAVKP